MIKKPINKKYPKSKTGKQCIGPCYERGSWILHPITLDYRTELHHSFCPVMEFEYISRDGKKIQGYTDECNIPTKEKDDIMNEDIEMNFLVPQINFEGAHFLKIYYNIHSFDDSLDWITNNNSPIFTKLRVMECAWKAYGPPQYVDDRLIAFYKRVIEKIWSSEMLSSIGKYIVVDKNNIYLGIDNDYLKNGEDINEIKKNYFMAKFANSNIIYKFFDKFITKAIDKDTMLFQNDNIQKQYSEYILKKIDQTIKN